MTENENEPTPIAPKSAFSSSFPHLEISGGPHGKDTVFKVNGERLSKVSRVEAVFDVQDAVRIKYFQFAEGMVDVRGLVEDGGVILTLNLITSEEHEATESRPAWFERAPQEIVRVTAPTVREALQKAIDQLPPEGSPLPGLGS